MERIIITTGLIFATVLTLAGCSGGSYDDGAPAPQSKPSSVAPENVSLYEASDYDENGLRHWLFTQKMADGTTVTCIAADNVGNSSLAIDCPTLTASPAPAQ